MLREIGLMRAAGTMLFGSGVRLKRQFGAGVIVIEGLDLTDLVQKEMKEVAKTHSEIYDTEPRGKISDEISEACDQLGWKPVDL